MASSVVKAGTLCPLHSQVKQFPSINSSLIPTKLTGFHLFRTNSVTLRRSSRNASLLPLIRAQTSPDYIPDSKFYKVEAILRECALVLITDMFHGNKALLKMGIRGVTVSDVRGFGAQGGSTERQGGSEFSEGNFVAKVKMEIVVSKDQVEAVIDKIIEEGRTGEIGDGKIFLVPVADVIRVRTGERGEKAERMTGGWYEMSAAT
ncbi:Nitrogen regulatory protein P-II-like protein [Morus notabilis]|uniref:Nitrogen regulatory protein P-II-like protein n=1 Tax=Morus notabilis TaxID=981085 RepID=W9R4B9_9ROSA|nr:Nitrogen regulatory protein P-II-like protein [Morus notabilis]